MKHLAFGQARELLQCRQAAMLGLLKRSLLGCSCLVPVRRLAVLHGCVLTSSIPEMSGRA